MRILHVVPTFYPAVRYGGPIYSVLQLCQTLKALGCELRVLTTDADGPNRLTRKQQNDPTLASLDITFCRRIGSGMIAPGLLRRLPGQVAWADVVHLTAVYNSPTLPTLLIANLRDKPLVWSPRGALQRWPGSRAVRIKEVWESVCRMLMPHAALHVTSDAEAAESARQMPGVPTVLIPNGIHIPNPVPVVSNGDSLKLLFIGRLDPKKGLENLIAALAMLDRDCITNWHLNIAGGGEESYISRLRGLCAEGAMTPRIDFVGHVEGERKDQMFRSADVVVVPSHTENFGMVVAEALAHSRPVIASRGTPWQGLEQHGCGLWVNNDPSSLASAIQQIARQDRAAMGERGHAWMTQAFSWGEQGRRMLSFYEYLAGRRPSYDYSGYSHI